jgi:HPt (histidine-containing phosphotransfer) domain-containing protein
MSSAQTSRFRAAARLLPRFVAHRRRDIGEVGLALARDDFETIARIGHNMRGNGESYGFPEVSALGARLEAAANTRDRRTVEDIAGMLEGVIANIERSVAEVERAPSESQVRAHEGPSAAPTAADGVVPGGEDVDVRRKGNL